MPLIVGTNSYFDLDFANDYFSERFKSNAWIEADGGDKTAAILFATKQIENNAFLGTVTDSAQEMNWPRKRVSYWNYSRGALVKIEEDVVPLSIQYAILEQALHLLENESLMSSQPQTTFEQISVGPISIADSNATNGSTRIPKISKHVAPLIDNFLIRQSSDNGWWRVN